MEDKQEVCAFSMAHYARHTDQKNSLQMIDIIETVYRGASKGRGLVVSPKGTSLSIFPQ